MTSNPIRISIISIILLLLTTLGCGGSGSNGSGGGSSDISQSGGNSSSPNYSYPDPGDPDPRNPDPGEPDPENSNSITLSWEAPNTNSDGSDLTDLAGYKIYYGTSSGNYTVSVNIGNSTSAVINNLSSGTWYFAITAYDISGSESDYSNEVSVTI